MQLTLEEAMSGTVRGVEVPIRCPVHDDSNASASVNVIKKVWFCYACGANGKADGKGKPPSSQDIEFMLKPETGCRIYPEAYLELFDDQIRDTSYWAGRFERWVVAQEGLGTDPVSEHPVFPVRTPQGLLAGVGHRISDAEVAHAKETGGNPSRYKYPYRWSASTVLDGAKQPNYPELVLVEGAADRISLTEVGINARGAYGAGLHAPQIEQLLRAAPKVVLLGFDMDDAGEKASARTSDLLAQHGLECTRVTWPAKDPGDCTPEQRVEAVASAVGSNRYRRTWSERVSACRARFASSNEERR